MVIIPTLYPLNGNFLMYDKISLVGTPKYKKNIVLKLNPFRIYEISWNKGVLGSPNENVSCGEGQVR